MLLNEVLVQENVTLTRPSGHIGKVKTIEGWNEENDSPEGGACAFTTTTRRRTTLSTMFEYPGFTVRLRR